MKNTDALVAKFRKKLLEEKEKLLNVGIINNREDLTINPDELADESDVASSLVNQAVTTNIRDREIVEIKRIEEALLRLEQGEYFECDECGDKIEEKRLAALPTTKLCLPCAEHSEHEKKQFAS